MEEYATKVADNFDSRTRNHRIENVTATNLRSQLVTNYATTHPCGIEENASGLNGQLVTTAATTATAVNHMACGATAANGSRNATT